MYGDKVWSISNLAKNKMATAAAVAKAKTEKAFG